MKNAIILSGNTGQGHNSCAEAIREVFEEKGVRCDICDSLAFVSPLFSRLMSWGHSFMYLHIPGLFRWGYHFNECHPALLQKGSPMYRILTSGAGRLREAILKGGYDTVICTHVFPAIALTRLLERDPMPVRTALVATDYTCCPGTESCGLYRYFLPCASPGGVYQSSAAFRDRAVVTGIPVRRAFWIRREKEAAKNTLHIGANNRHLLMMCGSMGCGPITELLRQVTGNFPADLEVTAICGTNEKLRERLTSQYEQNDRVHIVGYTDDISLYMDSADLYLTKPGGISVTEAAAKELPMAFVDAVSGCEKYNMDFFTGLGAAVTDPSITRLAQKCIQLLSSDRELEQMRRALREYNQPNGAERIYDELSKGN